MFNKFKVNLYTILKSKNNFGFQSFNKLKLNMFTSTNIEDTKDNLTDNKKNFQKNNNNNTNHISNNNSNFHKNKNIRQDDRGKKFVEKDSESFNQKKDKIKSKEEQNILESTGKLNLKLLKLL